MNLVCRPFGTLFNDVNSVQDEVARLFNRVSPYVNAHPGPYLNVREDDQAVYVDVDLPGVDPARIDVTVTEGNHLAIRGERPAPEPQGGNWVRQERAFGEFLRELNLPALVDANKVEARYEAGVLKLTLPKHEAVKPRKITVKAE